MLAVTMLIAHLTMHEIDFIENCDPDAVMTHNALQFFFFKFFILNILYLLICKSKSEPKIINF